jgi:drug/metabolite transporter (DMT)-like permease
VSAGRTAAVSSPGARPARPAASGAAPRWQVFAALGIVYVVWGSTYLAIRVMVRDVPPLLGAGTRFLLAGALLLGLLAARRGGLHAVRVPRGALASAALVGALLPAGGNGLVTVAEKHVPSGLAALLVASVPLWVVVYRTLWRDRVAGTTLVGVGLGFAGVALLLAPGGGTGGTVGGSLLIVLAAASWAAGSFASPRLPLPSDPLVSTGWQMVFGGLVLGVAGLAAGETSDVSSSVGSTDALLSLGYLIVFGSLLAYSAYVWLLQRAPISQVATYAYVNPVIAVALGWAILGESFGVQTLIGAAIIVGSVAIIVRKESAPRPARAERAAVDAGAPPAAVPERAAA